MIQMITGVNTGSLQTCALQLSIARSVDEIERIRPDWERLQWHPNADIDHYLTVVNARENIVRPHVVALKREGIVAAMLAGRIEQVRLECRIGYWAPLRPVLRHLVIVQGGAMGDVGGPHARALIGALIDSLRQGEAEAVLFDGLPCSCDLYPCARSMPPPLCRDLAPTLQPRWLMDLPDSIEEFLARRVNAKHRYWLRRMERLFERDAGGPVTYRILRSRAELDELCEAAEAVARTTYQRALGMGFADTPEQRRRLELAASRGWLRAYLACVAGRPCAFWIGTLYQGTFYLDYTGYDPACGKFEPGSVLFLKMIGDLCRSGVRRLDCGPGDAFYKRRFGERSHLEAFIYIFAPRLRSRLLGAIHSAMGGAGRLIAETLGQTAIHRWIKKQWRLRLAQGMHSAPG